jgi:Protein of unknown function (DUF2937)
MRKTGVLFFGLIGAVLLSQFPEFFQQYVQRLGGRLDEVTRQVTALDQRAAEAGTSTPLYLRDFILNRDPQVQREGQALQGLVERRVVLAEDYKALTGSDRWWRAGRFATNFDWDVAATTFRVYEPAVPVTAEAAIYAGAGCGTGMAIFLLVFGLRRRRPDRARR